jgi:hypothetical protein
MGKTKGLLFVSGRDYCRKEAFFHFSKTKVKTFQREQETPDFDAEENGSKRVESLTFGV